MKIVPSIFTWSGEINGSDSESVFAWYLSHVWPESDVATAADLRVGQLRAAAAEGGKAMCVDTMHKLGLGDAVQIELRRLRRGSRAPGERRRARRKYLRARMRAGGRRGAGAPTFASGAPALPPATLYAPLLVTSPSALRVL